MNDKIERAAIYAGSFDPATLGHLDVIERASKLFDKVIVAIGVNPAKKTLFTPEERVDIISELISGFANVSVDTFSGLLVEFAKSRNACAIIRGLRAMTDFDYEFQIGLANMDMCPQIETIFLLTSPRNIFISSSLAKEIARFGGDASGYLPAPSIAALNKKLGLK